jgi:ubiquinone/menaquinone biosynthesis C-methylase UbiE
MVVKRSRTAACWTCSTRYAKITGEMSGRGEGNFRRLPAIGARLYSSLTSIQPIQRQFDEIADFLVEKVKQGHLLDVGAGPGYLLRAIHQRAPKRELYGLDIAAMVETAAEHLLGLPVHLRQGSISDSGYDDEYFDLVTCTGSFYLWDHPQEGLNEIYRLLKPGCSAFLFETVSDFNKNEFNRAVRTNLQGRPFLARWLAPVLLGKQSSMTYTLSEIERIVGKTRFTEKSWVERIRLVGLPNWVRIRLSKD